MYKVFLEKTFKDTPRNVFRLFTNGTVFKLTDADEIESSFIKDGKFSLSFSERGTITGSITEIELNKKIVLNWNVDGFGREPEINTQVIFTLSKVKGNCILTLEHSNIKYEGSFKAKQSAWSEILDEMGKELKPLD